MENKEMPKSQTTTKNRSKAKLVGMLIVATVLLIVFLVIALLLAPRDSIPEFEITDRQGSWEAQGTIAVFDDTIQPGSNGQYYFILKNDSESVLRYGINLKEYFNGAPKEMLPFMQYRLKMNGKFLDDEEWHYINDIDYNDILIIPDTEQLMELEWRWVFEDGKDENDTLIGHTGGKLSVVFFVWAEVVIDNE